MAKWGTNSKRENWYYLTYNWYRPLRRECGIARMNLNSKTNCITASQWRQRGRLVRSLRVQIPFWPLADVVLGSPEFNFSSTLVNNQLVRLLPVGILNLVMVIYHYLLTLVLKSPDGEWTVRYTFITLCHADNVRAHASYMLCSTTRKST